MATRISQASDVPPELLAEEGVLDAFTDIDSRFHVDPHLLQYAESPEFKGSYQRLRDHFQAVIKLLEVSSYPGDRFYGQAYGRLVFPELPFAALGYSKGGIGGSGIGPGIARQLAATAAEIVEAGIKEPDIFELVGLFEDNVGADRISDMVVSIILPDILTYTRRVAENLRVDAKDFTARGQKFELPYIVELPAAGRLRRRPIVFLPKEILRPLPVAYDWDDIDYVCAHNREVRERINHIIGDTWKRATSGRVRKRDLRRVLLHHPEALIDLLSQYRKKPADRYDFNRDPDGELIWDEIARDYAERFPLKLDVERRVTVDDVMDVVTTICERFRELVEDNGMFAAFYNDLGDRRNERFAQLLFFTVADAYCAANNLDLSREPNAGRGPVDFKVRRGYGAKVNVEVKYSTNSKLIDGFTKQLAIYDRAERSHHSVYLVIRTSESTATIDALRKLRTQRFDQGSRVPDLVILDGRHKPFASKA
jgi:hypothetical protein